MAQTAGEAFTFTAAPALSAALKRGDESAFAWLHSAWSARIHRYCFALAAGDEALAGEIAQAAWLRIVRHIRVVPDEAALWSWVACAARHAASDLRKKGGRYLRALARFAEWFQPARTVPGDDVSAALDAALACLTPEETALITARYFAHDSLDTIAARSSVTARAVEGRLARLRERLRKLIAQQLQ